MPDPIPFREDRAHAAYDPDHAQRFWRVLLQADRVFKQFRTRVHRQGEPGPLLLGQLRSRGDALFRAPGAAASGRHPAPAGCGDPRGLLARGQQRRLLAGRRRDRLSGVLFLRLSGAGRLRRGAGAAGGGLLPRAAGRVHPALRCGPHRRRAGRDAAGVPADHLRGRGQCRQAGTAPRSNTRRADRVRCHGAAEDHSIARTISSVIFLASPNSIIVLFL